MNTDAHVRRQPVHSGFGLRISFVIRISSFGFKSVVNTVLASGAAGPRLKMFWTESPAQDLMSRTWNARAPMTKAVALTATRMISDWQICDHGTGSRKISSQHLKWCVMNQSS